jgi:hypothetical protein
MRGESMPLSDDVVEVRELLYLLQHYSSGEVKVGTLPLHLKNSIRQAKAAPALVEKRGVGKAAKVRITEFGRAELARVEEYLVANQPIPPRGWKGDYTTPIENKSDFCEWLKKQIENKDHFLGLSSLGRDVQNGYSPCTTLTGVATGMGD